VYQGEGRRTHVSRRLEVVGTVEAFEKMVWCNTQRLMIFITSLDLQKSILLIHFHGFFSSEVSVFKEEEEEGKELGCLW